MWSLIQGIKGSSHVSGLTGSEIPFEWPLRITAHWKIMGIIDQEVETLSASAESEDDIEYNPECAESSS